jgi:SNF2 family DNA or RNA helicase
MRKVLTQAPEQFRGGILADCMGLGKTLSMISLLSSPALPANQWAADMPIGRNLLIVPLALLDHWVEEIVQHTNQDSPLKIWTYHRSGCSISSLESLLAHDIIITTYDVLSTQWRKRHKQQSLLLSIHWHRVVLDEGCFWHPKVS